MVEENGGSAALDDLEDIVFVENSFTFEENLAAFDLRSLLPVASSTKSSVRDLVNATGQFATDGLFEVGLVDLHFFGQTEKLENILIAFVTDGTEQGGDGQLLLTIDVSVHDTVDVRCNSIQLPLKGMIRALYNCEPLACTLEPKKTPGERCNCETTTRSAPLMIKVPLSVM